MRVSIVQNKVFENKNDTFNHINNLLSNDLREDLDFLVFPEMFTTPYENNYILNNKQTKESKELDFLKNLAIKYNTYVIGGSIPFEKDNKLYNTCFVFNRLGEIIYSYDKMHMFEVTYPNGKHYSESDTFSKGSKLGIFDTEFGKMGVMICFDIRFPELAEKLMKNDAKVIFVPAAFNTYTGPMHWEVTFRARAIDNQLFLIGCSPAANSFGKYQVYGHSIVTNPFGKVINSLEKLPGVMTCDLDLTEIEKARNSIPIIKNKRKW